MSDSASAMSSWTDAINSRRVLHPVLQKYAGVLNGLARDLLAPGNIRSSYDDLPFEDRLIQIAKESGSTHTQLFDILGVGLVIGACTAQFASSRVARNVTLALAAISACTLLFAS